MIDIVVMFHPLRAGRGRALADEVGERLVGCSCDRHEDKPYPRRSITPTFRAVEWWRPSHALVACTA
jgi:hypothetical protein